MSLDYDEVMENLNNSGIWKKIPKNKEYIFIELLDNPNNIKFWNLIVKLDSGKRNKVIEIMLRHSDNNLSHLFNHLYHKCNGTKDIYTDIINWHNN